VSRIEQCGRCRKRNFYLFLVDGVEKDGDHVLDVGFDSAIGSMVLACLFEEEELPRDALNRGVVHTPKAEFSM